MSFIKTITYLYFWSNKANHRNSLSSIIVVSGFLSLNLLTILIFVDFLMTKYGYSSPFNPVISEQTFLGRRISSFLIALVIMLMTLSYYFFNMRKIKSWLLEFRTYDMIIHKKWKAKVNIWLLISFITFILSLLLSACKI